MPNLNIVEFLPKVASIVKITILAKVGKCEVWYEADGELHKTDLTHNGKEWVRPVTLH